MIDIFGVSGYSIVDLLCDAHYRISDESASAKLDVRLRYTNDVLTVIFSDEHSGLTGAAFVDGDTGEVYHIDGDYLFPFTDNRTSGHTQNVHYGNMLTCTLHDGGVTYDTVVDIVE